MLEIFISILFGLLTLFLVSLFNQNFIKNRKHLAPGPLRLPIFGNLLQIAWINSKEPHVALSKLAEVHGNIMSIQLGSVYSVCLNSFEVMDEYLTKHEFSDRYFNAWIGERSFHKRVGLVFANYPHPFNQIRRFCLKNLKDLGFGKREKMHSFIQAELVDLVNELKSSVKKNNGIHTFNNFFNLPSLNIVWSMLAGTRFEQNDPKMLKLVKMVEDFAASLSLANGVLLAFPEWKDWFPNLTGMSTQRKCFKETNDFFQEFINERKALGIYKTCPENLVDNFLREMDAGMADSENVFTEQTLVTIMSDFFMAGSETANSTLSWFVLYLILNPKVQSKLQKEVDLLVPKGTLPDAELEPKMHYVRATLAETHRMASVVLLGIPRATTEDMICGTFLVPKGTNVIANLHGIHYDKSYWKDPENFRPERFLDENGNFKNDPRLRPFGFGKRACPGEPLAQISLIHFITVLVQNFTFLPVPDEPLPSMDPVCGVTNFPQVYRALVKCRC
ncbi:Methyl farnesoate epoxidase [Orchesella cincta]|uniref:Methyl farnesoate epoxidase n=1 Tax=Orchesella cincta TaxID=48709 RepID=A0A1D2MDU3_ORCCI|nr:Methyl farnesoate epoxidase [Orchesella cincta]